MQHLFEEKHRGSCKTKKRNQEADEAKLLSSAFRGSAAGCFRFFIFWLLFFRAAPTAYRGSQARGPIGATAASLCHSHSYWGSKPHLLPAPRFPAMSDP